jgi:hypothetical protein
LHLKDFNLSIDVDCGTQKLRFGNQWLPRVILLELIWDEIRIEKRLIAIDEVLEGGTHGFEELKGKGPCAEICGAKSQRQGKRNPRK